LTPLLEARGLVKRFAVRRGLLQRSVGAVHAVDGVDLDVAAGECLALVGESGSGKTTLGRLVTRLEEPDAGTLRFAGEDLLALSGAALRRRRRDLQVVFQDPWGSLNPRMTVAATVEEPILVHRLVPRAERGDRVAELLGLVGLSPDLGRRYPHQLSGGQRQRVGIARALATGPRLIVADEPVSALDVSVRAQIVNLLADLQRRLGLAMLFIGHDLALVEQLADRVAVMYLGRIVEQAPTRQLYASPQHPYTVSLLEAVPVPDPTRRARTVLAGEPPSPTAPPPGCRFHPRCPVHAELVAGGGGERCRQEDPELLATGGPALVADTAASGAVDTLASQQAACHYPGRRKLSPIGGVWSGRAG
jgi:oligopeptide transport system ATP-binding protein